MNTCHLSVGTIVFVEEKMLSTDMFVRAFTMHSLRVDNLHAPKHHGRTVNAIDTTMMIFQLR
jgi:hypothetical protein